MTRPAPDPAATAPDPAPAPVPAAAARQALLRTLALAEADEVLATLGAIDPAPDYTVVRGPEVGLVMVRGRIGGGGAPFNAGEATVARCTVKLASGEVGFGHVMGRDEMRAKAIALLDALAQTAAHAETIAAAARAMDAARTAREAARAAEVAATRVDFFTMVRGED
ncbi:Protein phnG [Stappia sp. 22II-S9-Z10]|nr:Protein phnG [Stappia sp. 22II-S9-Z10]